MAFPPARSTKRPKWEIALIWNRGDSDSLTAQCPFCDARMGLRGIAGHLETKGRCTYLSQRPRPAQHPIREARVRLLGKIIC